MRLIALLIISTLIAIALIGLSRTFDEYNNEDNSTPQNVYKNHAPFHPSQFLVVANDSCIDTLTVTDDINFSEIKDQY